MDSDVSINDNSLESSNESSRLLVEALKLFVKQFASYAVERSDTNLISLQKQLDIIYNCSTTISKLYCDSRHLIVTEAVSSLITLINDPDVMSTVACKILSLFQKFVSSPALHVVLKKSFHFSSTLSSFLVRHQETGAEDMLLLCLNLLKVLTYNVRINNADVYVDALLKFISSHIMRETLTSERILPCMVILANISRNNVVVQNKIRGMEGARYFYRSIINKINSPSSDLMKLAALSTFTSVAIDEDVGLKFFQSKDVIRTIHLVFHKILNHDLDVQCFALDIMIDILSKERLQPILLQDEYLNSCLTKIILLLNTETSVQTVCKVYEMLCFVGSQTILRQTVGKALHEAESAGIGEHPIAVALHWLNYPPQKLWNPSVWSAKFLNQMLKISTSSTSSVIHDNLDIILGTISDCFIQRHGIHDWDFDVHLEKMVASLQLLFCLSQDKNHVSDVVKFIGSGVFSDMIGFLLCNWNSSNSSDHDSLSNYFNGQIADAILHLLLIMMETANSVNGIQERLHLHLQDVRLMSVLAYSLTSSESNERVKQAFQILFLGSRSPNFCVTSLVDVVVDTNQMLERLQRQVPLKCNAHDAQFRCHGISNVHEKEAFNTRDANKTDSISMLVDRFKNNVDMKDVQSSEIMELYEHKILSLEMKEKHLEGLLDAKANALQHADRVLIEYRSRWARSDAETLQLRSMLKESEKRSEKAKEELTNAHREIQQRQRDLGTVTKMNNELDQKNKDLKENCVLLHNKIADLQNTLRGLSEEINVLSDANTVMKRSRDNFEEKTKLLETNVSKLEAEKQCVTTLLKERDLRIKELKKAGKEFEQKNDKFSESIVKLTNDKDNLHAEIDALKVQYSEKEATIVILQAELEKCRTELDQHKQLTALIHNMSAGNLKAAQQQQRRN